MSDLEMCCDCDMPTGRAGIGEDSLYAGEYGPYCEDCWEELPAKFAARIRELETALRRIDDLNKTRPDENGHTWAASDLINQEIVAARSTCTPAPITPAEARENVVDTIEEIICETHDLDVRDRDYAENVVAWLEKYHPAALRALAEGDE